DAKDLAPRNEQKSLEDLRAQMQKHFERLAPVLDLEALLAPSDGIANREVSEGRRGTISDRTPDTDWHRNGPWHRGTDRHRNRLSTAVSGLLDTPPRRNDDVQQS